jgi:hypothetical protein
MPNVRLRFVKFLKIGHYKLAGANNEDNVRVPFLLKRELFDAVSGGTRLLFPQGLE